MNEAGKMVTGAELIARAAVERPLVLLWCPHGLIKRNSNSNYLLTIKVAQRQL